MKKVVKELKMDKCEWKTPPFHCQNYKLGDSNYCTWHQEPNQTPMKQKIEGGEKVEKQVILNKISQEFSKIADMFLTEKPELFEHKTCKHCHGKGYTRKSI